MLSSRVGECKFYEICHENSTFSVLSKTAENNKFEAHCNLCKKNTQIKNFGFKALQWRGKEKHNTTVKPPQQMSAISNIVLYSHREHHQSLAAVHENKLTLKVILPSYPLSFFCLYGCEINCIHKKISSPMNIYSIAMKCNMQQQ